MSLAAQAILLTAEDKFKSNLSTTLTWAAYELLLNFPSETSTVWKAKWSIPKVLYLALRYYGLANLGFYVAVSTSFHAPFKICQGWFYYLAISTSMPTLLGEALMFVRINALYGLDRKMIIFTSLLYTIQIVSFWGPGLAIASNRIAIRRPPGNPLPGCLSGIAPSSRLRLSLFYSIPAIIIPCLYFLLTLAKFLRLVTLSRDAGRVRGIAPLFGLRSTAPTIHLFVRDGAFYFLLGFVVQMLNMIVNLTIPTRALSGILGEVDIISQFTERLITFQIMAFYPVVATRMSLNLRQSELLRVGTSRSGIEVQSIFFAPTSRYTTEDDL
ncbi:hypothetical protein C8J57DRAFT_1493969 [Mycena rebaudengoi]|nr:hypothetical protein C8J57DRAFT_1493969 [Mycena rebaudengoi]